MRYLPHTPADIAAMLEAIGLDSPYPTASSREMNRRVEFTIVEEGDRPEPTPEKPAEPEGEIPDETKLQTPTESAPDTPEEPKPETPNEPKLETPTEPKPETP